MLPNQISSGLMHCWKLDLAQIARYCVWIFTFVVVYCAHGFIGVVALFGMHAKLHGFLPLRVSKPFATSKDSQFQHPNNWKTQQQQPQRQAYKHRTTTNKMKFQLALIALLSSTAAASESK